MAVSVKLFSVLLFLSLLGKGKCQCSVTDISIDQSDTGKQVKGKMEWRATISNNCICSQLSVKLDCSNFETVESVDPSILEVQGSVCLVNGGAPIFKSKPISFTYAADQPFPFKFLFSTVACS